MRLLNFVVGPSTTPQNWLVRRGLPQLINTRSCHLLSDEGLFNTHPHEVTPNTIELGAWINGGRPDSGNLIAGGPMDLGKDSDTILNFVVGPNTTPQNRVVR